MFLCSRLLRVNLKMIFFLFTQWLWINTSSPFHSGMDPTLQNIIYEWINLFLSKKKKNLLEQNPLPPFYFSFLASFFLTKSFALFTTSTQNSSPHLFQISQIKYNFGRMYQSHIWKHLHLTNCFSRCESPRLYGSITKKRVEDQWQSTGTY